MHGGKKLTIHDSPFTIHDLATGDSISWGLRCVAILSSFGFYGIFSDPGSKS